MALRIISPANSFVQFTESNVTTSCEYADITQCLPVYEDDDVNFQFVVEADTTEEADDLCDLTNSLVSVGLAKDCASAVELHFSEKPERFRISDFQVLYNWSHGLPGATSHFPVGFCFVIKIDVDGLSGCSNCFNRIANDCHTSVIEYGNDDNAFGFNYCNSGSVEGGESSADCDPTFIQFTNQSTLVIPYTASLIAKYGVLPSVKVWIYDTNGELVNMTIRQAFDTYPPTEIRLDFGGLATGVIRIS